jgi:hypothetical protein
VAQSGSAPGLGPGGPRFESLYSDQVKEYVMSKGSTPRPYSVSQQEFANSFDRIFRKPSPKDIEDARNEQEAFDYIKDTVYNMQEGDKECK